MGRDHPDGYSAARQERREQIAREDRAKADAMGLPRLTEAEIDSRLAEAYRKLRGKPGDLVSLTHIRNELADVPTDEVNAALKRLDRERALNLVPDSNQKAIPQIGWDAALRIGPQDNHFVHADSGFDSRIQSGGAASSAPARRHTRDMPDALVHDIERDIRAAHLAHVSQPGRNEWSMVSRWRAPLDAKYGKDNVDRVFIDMATNPDDGVALAPESNQKVMSAADRAASVWMGNQDKHLLSLRGSENPAEPKLVPRPPASTVKTGRARAALSGKQPVNMAAVTRDLEALRANPQRGDRDKVDNILKPLIHAQLDQVAQDYNIQVRGTLAEKRAQLVQRLVGRRLESDAIFALRQPRQR